MMENKVPRKLKKELRKVDCLETSQPFIKMEPNPFSPSKMMFTQNSRVKLKEGVKINKWTKRLVRNILREVRRNHKRNTELAMKRQMEWIHKGINPMTELKEFEKVLPKGGKNLTLTRLTAEKEVFVEGMKFINGVPFPYRFQGRSIWGANGWELTECKEAVDNGQ